MSKKLKDLHWQPVALEGFPITNSDTFQGFVGLEECTDYGLDRETRKSKKKAAEKSLKDTAQSLDKSKKKRQKKRKIPVDSPDGNIPYKKVKLSNGFIVESCTDSIAPSNANSLQRKTKKKQKKKNNKKQMVESTSVQNPENEKPDNGEVQGSEHSEVDMSAWAEFRLQEPVVRALAAQGFTRPTHIQQLVLPPAIHGRRDILAAAETGSGKTLAFGLPIISGILKLKERAAATGALLADIPYRKIPATINSSPQERHTEKLKKKKNKENLQSKESIQVVDKNKKKVTDAKGKESSEDGYSSGDNSIGRDADRTPNMSSQAGKMTPLEANADGEDYIEEIDVPVRKRDNSADEGNDSDEDNYLHLSEMLDSDDLADDSDGEAEGDDDEAGDSPTDDEKDDDDIESDVDDVASHADKESGLEESGGEDVILGGEHEHDVVLEGDSGADEGAETAGGVGCVRVVHGAVPAGAAGAGEAERARPLLALVVTPTRELALQVSRALAALARPVGLRVATLVGGMAAVKQERLLRARPELVVATVGRLWELVAQGEPHLQHLDAVKFLAVDEADRMLERGHFDELRALLERLNAREEARRARQTFVLSATLTLVHDLPAHLRRHKVTRHGKVVSRKLEKMTPQQKLRRLVELVGMTEPKVVDLTTHNLGAAPSLTEARVACAAADKDVCLYYLLRQHPGRTLVFCNSIGCVRRLATVLALLRCAPLPLHAAMPQRQRLKNLERFREQPRGLLVATDVAARGLDIPGVDHVVQYQVPRTAENYVHRAGRTARAHREGLNVLLVEPAEHALYAKLCRTLHKESEVPVFPMAVGVLDGLRAHVAAARALDALELRARRARQAAGWRARAARDLDMIVDDDDVPAASVEPGLERALKAKRRELAALLARPLRPPGFSYKYPSLNPAPAARPPDSALQVMKRALAPGARARGSKNAALLALGGGEPARKHNNKSRHKNK